MDNKTLQNDEIEALSAIYGKEWVTEDSENQVYSITLKGENVIDSQKSHEWDKAITFQFRLPPDYPSSSPPFYTLSAPWMIPERKRNLNSSLDQIYSQHEGESILFMWIEKAREYLIDDNSNNDVKSNDEDEYTDESCGTIDTKASSNKFHKHHHHSGDNVNTPIYHGEPIVDRRSTFQAHLSPVHCLEEVHRSLHALKSNKKIASATHNISAYRISGGPHNAFIQDCDDDGESHAGSRLLHLLQILDVKDVLVVVSRWFGGIQLGPDRFKHINNAARDILQKCGYIDAQEEESNQSQSGKGKKKSK